MKRTSNIRLLSIMIAIVVPLTTIKVESIRAQTPRPPVPDWVFPLGALSFGTGLNGTISDFSEELLKFGLNTYFDGIPLNPDRSPQLLTIPGETAYLNKDIDAGGLGWFFPNGEAYNPLFAEWDFNLASNESGDAAWDLQSSWRLRTGSLNSNDEWSIGPTSADLSSQGHAGYYLWGFNEPTGSVAAFTSGTYNAGNPVVQAQTDPNCPFSFWVCNQDGTQSQPSCSNASWNPMSQTNILPFPGVNYSNSEAPYFYIDFVSRIKPSDYSSITDPTTEIYALEMTILWSDYSSSVTYTYSIDGGQSFTTTSGSGMQSIPITINDVLYAGKGGNFRPLPNENKNILNFPSNVLSDPTKNITPSPYTIKRIKIQTSGKTPIGIALNLKGVNAHGIFVRGVRLRSDYADHLFRGDFDDHNVLSDGDQIPTSVNGILHSIHTQIGNNGWSHTKVLKCGNETGTPSFRAFTHFNEALRKYSKALGDKVIKNFYMLKTGGPPEWRSVYEDESGGNPPPPLQMEGIGFSSGGYWYFNTGPFFSYGSQIGGRPDHDFKTRWQAFNGGATWTGIPPAAPDANFTYWQMVTPLLFAGDAIPSEVKNHTNFLELGLTITGWNSASSITAANPSGTYGNTVIRASSDSDDYSTYTLHYQNAARDMSFRNQSAAKGSYPQNKFPQPNQPSLWTSFFSYPSTFDDQTPYASWPLIRDGLRKVLYDALRNGQPPPTTFTYDQLNAMSVLPTWSATQTYLPGAWVIYPIPNCSTVYWTALSTNTNTPPTCGGNSSWQASSSPPPPVSYDPTKSYSMGDVVYYKGCGSFVYFVCTQAGTNQTPVSVDQHGNCQLSAYWQPTETSLGDYFRFGSIEPLTTSEIREETWDCLTWGAKGIIFNPIGNDGGSNIGFCGKNFEDGVNSGFADVTNGDQVTPQGGSTYTFSELPGVAFHPNDGVIPPIRSSSDDPLTHFPDHVIWNGGDYLWVPTLSDYDIYDGPLGSSNKLLSAGDQVDAFSNCPPPNNTETKLDAYVKAMQNGWAYLGTYPSGTAEDGTKKSYYASRPQTHWNPGCQGPSCIANNWNNWVAFDRMLDAHYPSHGPHTYDPWWYAPYYANPIAPWYYNVVSLPTYYGVKDRADGVKRSTADIAPIASELAKLQWITSFSYSDLADNTLPNYHWAHGDLQAGPHPTGDGVFPFTVIQSRKVDRSTWPLVPKTVNDTISGTLVDPADSMYYNIGVFHDPDDPNAVYVTVANKRTWPIVYNADHSISRVDATGPASIGLLGAIDARRVTVQLKGSWTDYTGQTKSPSYLFGTFYTISDLRGKNLFKTTNNGTSWTSVGQEYIDPTVSPSAFGVDLEPGEGTLLRIAPATGLVVGRTDKWRYNNGHGVCEITSQGPGCAIANDRGVVWASNGSINFCRVKPAGNGDDVFQTLAGGNLGYQPQPLYTPTNSLLGHDPTIASKHSWDVHTNTVNGPDTIAVVYSTDDYISRTTPRSITVVILTSTDAGISWSPTGTVPLSDHPGYGHTLVPEVTGNGRDVLAPVITPAIDGFLVSYTAVSMPYRRAPNYQIHYYQGNWTATPVPDCPISSQCKASGQVHFVTSASRNEGPHNPTYETFYLAWEEDFSGGSSAIMVAPLEHYFMNGLTPESWFWLPAYQISQGVRYCSNHHPFIALKPAPSGGSTLPIVTWEGQDTAGCSGGQTPIDAVLGNQVTTSPGQSALNCWSDVRRVLIREETSPESFNNPPTFTTITSIDSEFHNLPLPILRVETNLCGGVSGNGLLEEVVFNDTLSNQVLVYRHQSDNSWQFKRLEEYAQCGTVSLPYELDPPGPPPANAPKDLGSIAYRSISADANGLYAQKIVANPPVETKVDASLIQTFSTGKYCQPLIQQASDDIKLLMRVNPDSTFTKQVNWLYAPAGVFQGDSIDDSTTTIVQSQWPVTEDTVRTTCFPTTMDSAILDMKRILLVDTSQLSTQLPDPTNFISYSIVIKDSASQLVSQVLDSAVIHGQGVFGGSNPGVDMNDTTMMGVGYHIQSRILPTASGVGYITIIWNKDTGTSAELMQQQQFGGTITLPAPNPDDSTAYKKSQPHPKTTTARIGDLNISIHPNPATTRVLICVDALPADNPFMAEVVSATGQHIATLYDATPEADIGLCYTLDCSGLANGTYYVRVANSVLGGVVKFQVVK
ncbi:MAG: T9SS type A sorting domain-containing protein [Bacteroidota bacterium]|nr:T9SS type A sorting domain-containing protein [Bacteroidota bacterium]MDP4231875.1 T9SS type A sorting domain-containing protein [Bacteroidota bacterium]MDP4242761.1 T9SS type A sorting domain-containing protein [Bacteroidota bacterium]MDP4287212.1 T9SS type A sorting domain-containing protein [Bacteroidota bacterium]